MRKNLHVSSVKLERKEAYVLPNTVGVRAFGKNPVALLQSPAQQYLRFGDPMFRYHTLDGRVGFRTFLSRHVTSRHISFHFISFHFIALGAVMTGFCQPLSERNQVAIFHDADVFFG